MNKIAYLALTTAINGLAYAAPRPNIVYFFADDLGWAGIKANQAIATAQGTDMTEAGKMVTPNIDSIVSAGINFSHSYGSPVCSPSRSCQQTGFHQGHTWADRNDPGDDKAMRTQDPTLGKLLNAAGYRNGMYGKWGYGASQHATSPVIVNEQTLPEHHGYHDCLVELHHVRAHTFNQPSLWYSFIDDSGTLVTDTELHLNDNTYPQLKYSSGKYYVDDLYAEAAKDFIKTEIAKQKAAPEPKPFFAQVSFQVPHSPFADIENTVDGWFDDYSGVDTASWTSGMKRYAAMVTLMDKRIGEIIDILEDPDGNPGTDDSVLENTLIIFASDNGGPNDSAPQGFNINGHLNKVKGHVYEGGIRVPLAMSWQGVIAPGQTSSRRVCVTDILPTFCELAGIDAPVGIDGTSFAPLLTGIGILRERPWLAYEDHNNGSWDWALIKDNYKLIQNKGGAKYYLYKLDTDEDESQDRAGWAAEQDRVAEMLVIAQAEKLSEGNLYANVWPTWTGGNGANVNAASSWQETGIWPEQPGWDEWPQSDTPEGNWNAVVNNPSSSNRTAFLDASIETLGFEVVGNPTNGARLELTLDQGISIEGRNEIRLSRNAILELNGGTLSSTRYLDIREGAELSGLGNVDANLLHAGTLDITSTVVTTTTTNIIPGSGGAGTELISNGGFENGTPVSGSDLDYYYSGLDAWTTDGASPGSTDGAKYGATKAHTGDYRSLIAVGYNLLQDTAHHIQSGETYRLQFQRRGFSGWDAGDQADIELSYEDGGTRHVVYTYSTDMPSGVWTATDLPIPAFSDTNAVGKKLWLSMGPGSGVGTSEWASFDDVSLTIETGTASLDTTNIVVETTSGLNVTGDYEQSASAKLSLPILTNEVMTVDGDATLGGRLECTLPSGFSASNGDRFTIITANAVSGSFSNPDGMLESGGHHFRIHYSGNMVELEKVAVTPNGTPIWWLELHGLLDDDSDTDRDGIPALGEYIAGTNPVLSNSVLAVGLETGGNHIIKWASVAGRIYEISGTTNLTANFQPLESGIPANPPENAYTTTATTANSFYRIKAERE